MGSLQQTPTQCTAWCRYSAFLNCKAVRAKNPQQVGTKGDARQGFHTGATTTWLFVVKDENYGAQPGTNAFPLLQ